MDLSEVVTLWRVGVSQVERFAVYTFLLPGLLNLLLVSCGLAGTLLVGPDDLSVVLPVAAPD